MKQPTNVCFGGPDNGTLFYSKDNRVFCQDERAGTEITKSRAQRPDFLHSNIVLSRSPNMVRPKSINARGADPVAQRYPGLLLRGADPAGHRRPGLLLRTARLIAHR